MLTALSGNSLLQPDFWLDPVNGVNYTVISQAPQHFIDSVQALQRTSGRGAVSQRGRGPDSTGPPAQVLGNVATVIHDVDPSVIAHYTVQRVMDVNAGVSGRDLGSVSADVQREIR